MTLSPDTGMDPQKEAILQRSPFTKIFLDQQMSLDTTMWLANLLPAEDKINGELKSILGDNWEKTSMAPLAVAVSSLRIFNRELPTSAVYGGIKSLVEIGYEVGNNEDCDVLLSDIAVQLRETGLLDPDALLSESARIKTIDAVAGLLVAGQYYRSLSNTGALPKIEHTSETPPSANDDNLKIFDDFLNGLNT